MTITIDLEPEKEARLRQKAARVGRDADSYALELLDNALSAPEPEPLAKEVSARPKQTLAEALAGHIGTQHSGRGDLSQNIGKAFTRLMVEKHKSDRV